jgi:hypothetical protein
MIRFWDALYFGLLVVIAWLWAPNPQSRQVRRVQETPPLSTHTRTAFPTSYTPPSSSLPP